jgi:3-methyl-2-oxobutanoate hydroxymethyltransferase
VKVEGGRERAPAIRAIAAAGIPVMGHLGLTPQSVRRLGGWKAQATSTRAALRLIEDAHILEHAGCYALVLESIPDRVAELVRERLEIPVLGIGAGSACDGQVLVTHDMLGLFSGFTPRFVKKYADLNARMSEAFREYIEDVRARRFPAQEHRFTIDDGSFEELLAQLRTSNRKLQRVR